RWLQLHLGWLLERLEFSDLDCVLEKAPGCDSGPSSLAEAQRLGLVGPQGENGRQILGAYQVSLVADLCDNLIEPRRGAYLDLRAAAGTRFAGSDRTYLQLAPEL